MPFSLSDSRAASRATTTSPLPGRSPMRSAKLSISAVSAGVRGLAAGAVWIFMIHPSSGSFADYVGITIFFKMQRKALVTGLDDLALVQNVHAVRNDMLEQTLIVRNDDHGAIWRTQRVHAFRNDLQRIDVETGIGFVEDAKAWLQKLHLQNFSALLFTAREANVERTLEHVHVDVEAASGVLHALDEFRNLQFRLATRLALAVHRNLQEFHRGNARNFHRVLESQEDALGGAFGRVEFEDRLAVIENVAFRHF